MIDFEVRGWDAWEADFNAGRQGANRDFRQVVSRGALNIKLDWARRWTGIGHLPHIARSISYDLKSVGPVHTAEIGPDKMRTQGPLGTIIESAAGRAKNRATHAGNRAGRAEERLFEDAVADVAEKAAGG